MVCYLLYVTGFLNMSRRFRRFGSEEIVDEVLLLNFFILFILSVVSFDSICDLYNSLIINSLILYEATWDSSKGGGGSCANRFLLLSYFYLYLDAT